jgi:hypothetical protein
MVTLSAVATTAPADDSANIYTTIGSTGPGSAVTITHDDGDPWCGWIRVNAKNGTDAGWTGFHFEITDVGYDVANVDWVIDPPYEPVTSMGVLSTTVDNSATGATVDFAFDGEVAPDVYACFDVYVDNTTLPRADSFGVLFYPTGVPEPTVMVLLGFGGLALVLRRSAA